MDPEQLAAQAAAEAAAAAAAGGADATQNLDPVSGLPIAPAGEGDELDATLDAFALAAQNKATTDAATAAAATATQTPEQQQAQTQALATGIRDGITAFTLPVDALKDVDLSDPAAIHSFVETSIRSGMARSIGLAMGPVQAALQQFDRVITQRLDAALKGNNSQNNEAAQMLAAIPELGDARVAPMLQSMNDHLTAQKLPLADRIKALRGFIGKTKLSVAPAADNAPKANQAMTGKAALDFLGL